MVDSIAVVIPFYQSESGILSRAILSALAQEAVAAPTIIVVDDASPVSAREELKDIMAAHPGQIVIIEQANAGPAAARNTALDNIPAGTDYVAFLDSDDVWIPAHLANASAALGAGFDFYFSDLFQLNQTVSAFNRAERIQADQHPRIVGKEYLHAYQGDMFDQILTGNIIGTPTVVYRHAAAPALRFRREFVYAGEDYLFWMELSAITRRIAFSSLCECACGAGVNIFSGSGWGTEKSLIRLHYEIKYKKALPRLFNLSGVQARENRASIRRLRSSFVTDLLHRLANRKPIAGRTLRSQLRVDPQTFFYFVPISLMAALKKL
jgi:succinoglycan biosynthesis protein ExoW